MSEITLKDDNIKSMPIVLQIVHLQFGAIPRSEDMAIEDVYNLAVVTDKYDLAPLVSAFYPMKRLNFTLKSRSTANKVTYSNLRKRADPRWLFVAWVFGHEEDFMEQAEHLTRTITASLSMMMAQYLLTREWSYTSTTCPQNSSTASSTAAMRRYRRCSRVSRHSLAIACPTFQGPISQGPISVIIEVCKRNLRAFLLSAAHCLLNSSPSAS